MIGLDTNVLVRFLVQDDPDQCALVDQYIDAASQRGECFIISPVVLCELVWVLETAYDCTRLEVAEALEVILRTSQFDFIDKKSLWDAWHDYNNGKADFSDYYIGRNYRQAGADTTLTFDKALKRSEAFTVMSAKSR
ncbi:MAG: PIN domain-containing protein [Spartobacteria bacterium]|nr:PIN domain-containing protein [Spartobacteria bacterium]